MSIFLRDVRRTLRALTAAPAFTLTAVHRSFAIRKVAVLLLFLVAITGSAWASKRVTVAQLAQILVADRGKPDAEVAQQIADLELTERLSAEKQSQLKAALPGDKAYKNLLILADQSAFLAPPASEIPAAATPDFAEQRRIMGLAISYVTRTIPELPNFFATRDTTYFEDTPLLQKAFDSIPYQPLHFVRASSATVLYRNGREEVDSGPGKKTTAAPAGLTTWGVFGPILGTVLLDAARSKLAWSHWEKSSSGIEAVFSYVVPQETSHYEVNYCCTPTALSADRSVPFRKVSGYHGEITINPQDGTVVRLSVEANLTASDPITRADLLVEYGPVEIGGRTYICPVRNLSMSVAQEVQYSNEPTQQALDSSMRPLKTMLNDVAFEQYHMFRADVRVLPDGEADKQVNPDKTESSETSVPAVEPKTVQVDSPSETKQAGAPLTPPVAAASQATPQASSPPEVQTVAKQDSTASQTPILRTTSREVVVDVVVTKGNDDPVLGLRQQDFNIMEDGKPQNIDFFESHTADTKTQSVPPAMPPMPKGARTNVPPAPEGDAVNVLLLDTLNTEPQDQVYAHREVMDFLAHMQPGTRVAIFMLGSKLRFVQGFTTDTSVLLAALNDKQSGIKVEKDRSSRSRSDTADDAADVAQLQVMQASPFAIAALQEAQADSAAHDLGARASMTFEALDVIGHYLAGVPGRKNLIWFASSFPVTIFPTVEQRKNLEKNPALPGFLQHVRATADLFTISRIAVYPIDAEGMMMEHIGEASAAGANAGGGIAHTGAESDSTMSPYHAGSEERANNIHSMEQLAASTGGRASYNTNDLNAAMRRAITDGETYYTIGYAPADTRMDGGYRGVEVKLAQGKYKLSYRHGYNADDASVPHSSSTVDPLVALLRFGMPGASGVLYGVHVEPAAIQPARNAERAGQNANLKAPFTRFNVGFTVREQDVAWQSDEKGVRRGKILLGLKVYDRDGNAVNWLGDTETLVVSPEQYSSIQKTGLSAHLEIDLPSNMDLHVVTAVYDMNSGKAGTLEVPVSSAPHASTSGSGSAANN